MISFPAPIIRVGSRGLPLKRQKPEEAMWSVAAGLARLAGEARLVRGLAALSAAAEGERALYRLVAVVVHVGGPRSGHFATYRRGNGFETKRWWYTSDTLVHEVSLQEVLRCTAYMLFFERAKPEPLTHHF